MKYSVAQPPITPCGRKTAVIGRVTSLLKRARPVSDLPTVRPTGLMGKHRGVPTFFLQRVPQVSPLDMLEERRNTPLNIPKEA
jgi:hypothetical protein